MKNTRARLLAAVFAEAKKKSIDAEFLRDGVAPAVIGKRISEASPRELCRLLEHMTGMYMRTGRGKFESSKSGLMEELKSVATERWGDDWEKSLNAFANANRPVRTHYRFLGVAALKAIKERIKELNRQDANEADELG